MWSYKDVRKTVASKLSSPVGRAVKAVGALTGNQKLSNVGGAIENPYLNYTGSFNPVNMYSNYKQAGGSFVDSRKPDGGGGGGGGGGNENFSGLYGNGSGGGGGGYTDPNAGYNMPGLQSDVTNKIRALQSAYDVLTGGVESNLREKANQLTTAYQKQMENLGTAFQGTANQLAGAYQARGLADSSYAGNAQGIAKKTYDTNLEQMQNEKTSNLANIGRQLQTARAQYGAAKSALEGNLANLGAFSGQDLQNMANQYQQQLGSLAEQQAGLGTQNQFVQAVQGIAPSVNQGTSQLQAQLEAINNSGTTQFAKDAIAKGLITQATGGDPNQSDFWKNQWEKMTVTGKA